MFGICMIIYLILTVIAVVMNSVSYRRYEKVNPRAISVCLAAGIVFFFGFLSLGDSSSSGIYIYYINGQRVGAGSITFGMGMFIGFMSMVFSWFLSWGLGYLFGYRGYRNSQKTSIAKLVFSGLGVFFGITGMLYSARIIIGSKVESTEMVAGYIISFFVFAAILVPNILSVVRYIKGKRS